MASSSRMPALPWRLHNVTVTANMGCAIDLKMLAEAAPGKFKRKAFPNVMIMSSDPHGSISCFGTGSVNITGCATVDEAKSLMYLFVYHILHQRLMLYKARVLNFTSCMLVVKYTTGFEIDLEALALDHADSVDYNPCTFEGLTLTLHDPECKAVIYHTGSVTITGLRTLEDAQRAYRQLLDLLKVYKTTTLTDMVAEEMQIMALGDSGEMMDIDVDTQHIINPGVSKMDLVIEE